MKFHQSLPASSGDCVNDNKTQQDLSSMADFCDTIDDYHYYEKYKTEDCYYAGQ